MKKIFTFVNWIAGIAFFATASAVEDVSWTQIMICAICGGYLACAYYISEKLRKEKRHSTDKL